MLAIPESKPTVAGQDGTMDDGTNPPKKGDTDRRSRLAEALRANLQKRKAQARSRRAGDAAGQRAGDAAGQRAGDADKQRADDADKQRADDADKQRAYDTDKERADDVDQQPDGLPGAGKMHKD
ncbi:hypothetical protein CK216_20065 [Mesorhizobium sp. WSM3876]|nr:hypothetical protein CK216_20065 [Mesorhizobium sp. WSM3876]